MHKQNYLLEDNLFNHRYHIEQLSPIGFVHNLENIIISLYICERYHYILLNEQEIFTRRQQDMIMLRHKNNLINISFLHLIQIILIKIHQKQLMKLIRIILN